MTFFFSWYEQKTLKSWNFWRIHPEDMTYLVLFEHASGQPWSHLPTCVLDYLCFTPQHQNSYQNANMPSRDNRTKLPPKRCGAAYSVYLNQQRDLTLQMVVQEHDTQNFCHSEKQVHFISKSEVNPTHNKLLIDLWILFSHIKNRNGDQANKHSATSPQNCFKSFFFRIDLSLT